MTCSYIAIHELEIYHMEIKIIPFIIKFGYELTIPQLPRPGDGTADAWQAGLLTLRKVV